MPIVLSFSADRFAKCVAPLALAAAALTIVLSPIVASAQIRISSQDVRLCPWPKMGPFPERGNNNGIAEWGSWADQTGDRFRYTTFVVNRDTHPRIIDWEVGGIVAPNLQPQFFAVMCSTMPTEPGQERTGPLYFERDATSMNTTVYDGKTPREKEYRPGQAFEIIAQATISSSNVQDHSQDPTQKLQVTPQLSVQVTTTVKATPGGYDVTQILENLTDKPVDVEFAGNIRTLKAKEIFKLAPVSSATFPLFIRDPMTVSDPESKTVAGVFAIPIAKSATHKVAPK